MPPKALQDCGIPINRDVPIQPYDNPSVTTTLNHSNLFNTMIYPFTCTVVYGAIWYQGETNAGYNTDKYACSFSKMIQYWRQTWNERANDITDIYFPFVINNYEFNVCPRYKHDVGYRLSHSGLAVAYGQQVEFQDPIVQSVAYTTDSRTVHIIYTGVSNIELRNPNGFEVCCQGSLCSKDKLWIPATISNVCLL
ncbi:unnamed protein product [Rotaria sordida]|uniref:Sialate O-acetylesterase domain-containing protein n=1 Tax=Rotaria sordida TaxID=392033 RepID=A0A813U3H7_9BILA|nr:unnamed protein product [Rotaria sordida]